MFPTLPVLIALLAPSAVTPSAPTPAAPNAVCAALPAQDTPALTPRVSFALNRFAAGATCRPLAVNAFEPGEFALLPPCPAWKGGDARPEPGARVEALGETWCLPPTYQLGWIEDVV